MTAQPRSKSLRTFVTLAIGSLAACLVAYLVMSVAFGAAADGTEPALLLEIVGFAAFILFVVSVVGVVLGAIGAIVRFVQ